jgi:hypothetical protein
VAIVLAAGAFLLWDLPARSPLQVVRDIAGGAARSTTLIRGFARFSFGLLLLAAGAALVAPVALGTRTFVVLETWSLLTGLLVNAFLGKILQR